LASKLAAHALPRSASEEVRALIDLPRRREKRNRKEGSQSRAN
jgi:hypothetical protein